MILDEPTAMLSPADSAALFESLGRLASEGATILLVTHRLPEVLDHCKRVTVLRGGKRVEDKAVSETNGPELAQLIVGGEIVKPEVMAGQAPGIPFLQLNSLSVKGSRGEMALKDVELTVRKGEILGVAGVDGSGQRELVQAIAGIVKPFQGTIAFETQNVGDWSPAQRIEEGLRMIPEDRHAEAVVEEWPLNENAALGLQRLAPFANGLKIDSRARAEMAVKIAERFHTKHGGLDLPMASLSGGNQQRFVAARALCLPTKLLVAFQPARGLDLKGTQEVYDGIRKACEGGAAALVVSFDLDELLEHCDRIVAMNNGRLFEPEPGQEKDRTAIGELMTGAR